MRAVVGVLLVFVVLASGAGLYFVLRPGGGGVELVYTVPRSDARATAEIIELRAGMLAPGAATARALFDGRVCLRVAGLRPEEVGPLRQAVERRGRAEVLATAEGEVQERYNKDGRVPPGHRAVDGGLLLEEPPLLENGDVNFVVHVTDTPNVSIGLQLGERGWESFRRVGPKLLERTPTGLVVLLLDGKVLSMSRIEGSEVTGVVALNGGNDLEAARRWAVSVLGRELPCLLGTPEVSAFRGKP